MDGKRNKSSVFLILSGGKLYSDWLKQWLEENNAAYCIAADRGLETADSMGLDVDLILGDYDSVDKNVLDKYIKTAEVLTYPPEKDYTDTHLAVKKAVEKIVSEGLKDSTEIYIVGATGTRLDHTLTNIFVLDEALRAGVSAFIIDRYNKIYIKNSAFSIKKSEQFGNYVSFIPMSEKVKISLDGMKYPLSGFELTQGNSLCQSNEIIGDEAKIDIECGKVIVIESLD
jgi:thiamine pyrophosphokinase